MYTASELQPPAVAVNETSYIPVLVNLYVKLFSLLVEPSETFHK